MKSLPSFVILFFFALLLAVGVNAQRQETIAIAFSPQFPRPGETVTARAILVGADPALATFQWYINEKLVKAASGKGKEEFSFALGPETRTVVDVTVTTPLGTRLSATKAITKEKALLVWWADTSVPVWYQGKAVPSPGSTVTILALPGAGFGENPANLLYSWSVNLEPRPGISGVGKNKFTLKVSLTEDVLQQISVRIANTSGTIAKDATLLLPSRRPEAVVYQLLATGGIDFSKSLSAFAFEGESGQPFDFIAAPFFFRTEAFSKIRYTWQVNDAALAGAVTRPSVLTLKTRPGEVSQNTIRVRAFTQAPEAQEAGAVFTASFR